VYYHTGSRRAYADIVGIGLRKAYPRAKVTVFNAGISGNTTHNALARLERDVLSRQPHLVTVMFGMNDVVRVPAKEFRENLVEIVAKVRDEGAEVLLLTPNNVFGTTRPPEGVAAYAQA